ncbi:MAG: methyl-accepting chemotaxis protein [Thermodesulfobacteriota bacterium]
MGEKLSLNKKLTGILLVFLAIGVINSVTIYTVVNQQIENARAINFAGRQRMLTQKMSKEAYMLIIKAENQDDLGEHRKKTQATVELFDTTLKGLINGSDELGLSAATAPEVVEGLQNVQTSWLDLKKKFENLLAIEDPSSDEGYEALTVISAKNVPLLKAMNHTVMLYEKNNNASKVIISQAILLLLTVIVAFVAWFFTRKFIVHPIKQSNQILHDCAEAMQSASSTMSSSAIDIADRASAQAASLEESSASLEEITSIAKQNTDNTGESNQLVQDTQKVVSQANDLMTRMAASMGDISEAGHEISKVIKTIDEIAFQTNLLALNAAVEAARAGEAGAGFAVVADEVRNLAMRAADAAKNTSEMIAGVIQKIDDGSRLVSESTESFDEVYNRSNKVASLTGEIKDAIAEQSVGIDQIHLAINEMDQSTQQNAASAEESASLAQNIKNDAAQLLGIVKELTNLVEGAGDGMTTGAGLMASHGSDEGVPLLAR